MSSRRKKRTSGPLSRTTESAAATSAAASAAGPSRKKSRTAAQTHEPDMTFAWRDDDRSFVVYPPKVVQTIAEAVAKGKKSVDIAVNPARPRSLTHRIHISSNDGDFTQVSLATQFSRPVRQVAVRAASDYEDNEEEAAEDRTYALAWQSQQGRGRWMSYSRDVDELLTKTQDKGLLSCHVNIGKHGYTINVRAMEQVNDATGTSRRVRRVVEDYPPVCDLASSGSNSSSDGYDDEDGSECEDDEDEEEEGASHDVNESDDYGDEYDDDEVVVVGGSKAAAAASSSRVSGSGSGSGSASSSGESATDVVRRLTKWTVMTARDQLDSDDTSCAVCLMDFDDDELCVGGEVVRLSKCKSHCFHVPCIVQAFNHRKVCPTCTHRYCVDVGTQPTNGVMSVSRNKSKLPGHAKAKGTIVVQYHFDSGVQGPEHPYPGQQYSGTSRYAYLPDSPEGNKVLRLLTKAFENRLVFTVGRSVTTGLDSCVVWNGVHHKTSRSGGSSNFGYPDKTYLQRVTQELAAKGIVDDEDEVEVCDV